MKLLRTIRLDPSDSFIFSAAAEPGDWAISGAFAFSDVELAALEGRMLSAFRSGFLGVPSLGWSTLAQVVEAGAEDRRTAIDQTAQCLLDRFGAPDLAAARRAAELEIDFAASLCDHPLDTLVAVHRRKEDGAIHEAFRTLRLRGGPKPSRAFFVFDIGVGDEDAPVETDLAALVRGERG